VLILFFIFSTLLILKNLKQFLQKNIFFISLSFSYLLLCSLAFVFEEALLPITILILFVLFTQIVKIHFIKSVFFAGLISLNIVFTIIDIDKFLLARSDHYGQLPELNEIKKVIKSKKVSNSVIVSINPAISYYFNIKWIGFPLAGANDICDVVNYRYSVKTINLSPKIPFELNLKESPIDFILITRGLDKIHGFLNNELEFERKICHNKKLKLIYKSKKATLWQVINNDLGTL
jgi:hypothetical protein